MEIKITTNQMMKVLQVLSWIIFLGLCIEAGGIVVNTFITLFINPLGVKIFWEGADYLSSLYAFDYGHFLVIAIIMVIVVILKTIMFYVIVKLFTDKKLNIDKPFSTALGRFILNICYLTLGIGLFSQAGFKYSLWLAKQGLATADLQSLGIAGQDVWLFMTIVLFVILQIVKKGIEIQNENDLTV
jgi:hypothetical protein